MTRYSLFYLLILLVLDMVGSSAIAQRVSPNDLRPADEPGENAPLPAEQYVPVMARRMKRAKIVWFNYDYARELGLDISEPLTPSQQEEVLSTVALGIPSPDDPADAFIGPEIRLFVDRYGGTKNGSGRAASFLGKIQIQSKALGRTPFAGGDGDDRSDKSKAVQDHNNGKGPIGEALREALWGELNHYNLPFGGNRVLMVLDRGTDSDYPYGEHHHDAIVIREEPIRPAHYKKLRGETMETIHYRVDPEETLRKLLQALPSSTKISHLDRSAQVSAALYRYVDRIAAQYARAYANVKYYHGATSAENIELSGKFLDYGTQTAQNDRGKIYVLGHQENAGSTDMIKARLITDFVTSLSTRLPSDIRLPNPQDLERRFEFSYDRQKKIEYLSLLGLPNELDEHFAKTPIGVKLAQDLEYFATAGAIFYNGKEPAPTAVTLYDFPKIVEALFIEDPSKRLKSLESFITANSNSSDLNRFHELTKNFDEVVREISVMLSQQSLPQGAVMQFMILSSRERNRRQQGLYRWQMMRDLRYLLKDYDLNRDPGPLSKYIDDHVRMNRRDQNIKFIHVSKEGKIEFLAKRPQERQPMLCEKIFLRN